MATRKATPRLNRPGDHVGEGADRFDRAQGSGTANDQLECAITAVAGDIEGRGEDQTAPHAHNPAADNGIDQIGDGMTGGTREQHANTAEDGRLEDKEKQCVPVQGADANLDMHLSPEQAQKLFAHALSPWMMAT